MLLKLIEMPYRGINRVRRELYRSGVLRPKQLPRPVVSVGNIVAGGAGKTPAVIRIARFLSERGLRVAILTRGHSRSGEEQGIVDSLDPAKWGDEPVLIKKHVKNANVIVGKNRYDNAVSYLSLNDCDLFLLDDGFQHLQVHRDLDIVIEPPAARFRREGSSALRDADLVLPRRLRLVGLEPVRGKTLFAFAGLADNEQFFYSLRNLGLTLVGTRGFPDHHRYRDSDITRIKHAARIAEAEGIVTTEKDAVKIADPEIVAVGAEFDIDERDLERIAEVVQR